MPLRYDDVAPEVRALNEACNQLLQSRRFEEVLIFALSIGNFVNAGTAGDNSVHPHIPPHRPHGRMCSRKLVHGAT